MSSEAWLNETGNRVNDEPRTATAPHALHRFGHLAGFLGYRKFTEQAWKSACVLGANHFCELG